MLRPLGLGLLALLTAAAWLGQARSSQEAALFLLAALPVWCVVTGALLLMGRQENHRGPLGLATGLTLLRGLLLSALAGFIPQPEMAATSGLLAWTPGLLYTAAALLDLVDGYVARRRREETALGARLDVALDALGLLVAPVAAMALGRLPAFYLLLGLAYYLFQGGLWLRRRLGRPLHLERLRASRHTRMYAGYQMGLVATVLFPVVGPPGTTIAAALFAVPTLTLFARDWFIATGQLPPSARWYRRLVERGPPVAGWLLLPLRLAAAGGLVALVMAGRLPPAVLVLAPLLVLGVATRLVSFIAAVFVTRALAHDDPAAHSSLTLATDVVMLLCLLGGGGRLSLLREDRWLLARAGEVASSGPPATPPALTPGVLPSRDG